MKKHHEMLEVALAEADILTSQYGVKQSDIVLVASYDVIVDVLKTEGGDVCKDMKLFGFDLRIVSPGKNFIRPIVLFNKVVRTVPDNTLVWRRSDFEHDRIAGRVAVISAMGVNAVDTGELFNCTTERTEEDILTTKMKPIEELFGF